MFDYRLVEAFAAILEEKGFERAAERLGLTQSAVSQRIKQLEGELGAVLVVRENPPRPTPAGERLLRHWRQVSGLEAEAVADLGTGKGGARQHLPIAVNTDSLSLWLLEAITPFLRRRDLTFEILVDEQESTLGFLKSGAVAGCVSPQRRSIQGCSSTLIGGMGYLLVASPAFLAERFPTGFDRASAASAPIVHFNRDDKLQARALAHALGEPRIAPPAHYVPSTEKYLEVIRAGLGYGLVSSLLSLPAIAAGSLVEVDRTARIEVPLYWHRWNRHSVLLEELTQAIIAEGGRILRGASGGGTDEWKGEADGREG